VPGIVIKQGVMILIALVFGLNLLPFGSPDIEARIFNHYENSFFGQVDIDGNRIPIIVEVESKDGGKPTEKKPPERLRITYKQNEKGGIAEITVDRTGKVDDPVVREIIEEIKKYASKAKNRETIRGKTRNFIDGLKVWRK